MTVPRPCLESRCSRTRRTFSTSRAWSVSGRARAGANRGRMSSSRRPGVASGDCPRTAVTTEPLRTFAATSAPAFRAADCSRPLRLGPGGAERASAERARRSTLSGPVVARVRDKQKPTRSGHTPDMTPAQQRLGGVSGTAGSRGCAPRGARWIDCRAPGAPRRKRDDSTSVDVPGVGCHQRLARYAHVRPGSAACSVSRACIGRLRKRPVRRPEAMFPADVLVAQPVADSARRVRRKISPVTRRSRIARRAQQRLDACGRTATGLRCASVFAEIPAAEPLPLAPGKVGRRRAGGGITQVRRYDGPARCAWRRRVGAQRSRTERQSRLDRAPPGRRRC